MDKNVVVYAFGAHGMAYFGKAALLRQNCTSRSGVTLRCVEHLTWTKVTRGEGGKRRYRLARCAPRSSYYSLVLRWDSLPRAEGMEQALIRAERPSGNRKKTRAGEKRTGGGNGESAGGPRPLKKTLAG